MATQAQVRDAIQGMVNTGWLAEPLTQNLPLLWDDVEGDRPPEDVDGLPVAYGRSTVRFFTSEVDVLGGFMQGQDRTDGQTVVQVFTPKGDGYKRADEIAQCVKTFFQRRSITGIFGWFVNVVATEVEAPGPWSQINVTAPFRYNETVSG